MMRRWAVCLLFSACSVPRMPTDAAPEPVAVAVVMTALAAPGLHLTEQEWTGADGAGGPAWVVRLDDPALTVLPSPGVQPLPRFVDDLQGSYVLVNGGFYDVDGQAMSLVVHDGVAHHEVGSGSGIVVGPHPVRVVHRDAWESGPTEALQSIDRIVNEGQSLVTARPEARRAARSVVAIAEEAVYIAVLADARSVTRTDDGVRLTGTSFFGPTLAETASFAVSSLSATAALNLDGAVSSALIVQTPQGRFVVQGERPVINALRLQPR